VLELFDELNYFPIILGSYTCSPISLPPASVKQTVVQLQKQEQQQQQQQNKKKY
jgi:hypothetical protein